jgi:ComF family protein
MKWNDQVYDWLGISQLAGGDCLLCGSPTKEGLCCACEQELPRVKTACDLCAIPLPLGGICGACQQDPPPFDSALATFRYQSPISDLIIALKFHGRLSVTRPLGRLFAKTLSESVVTRPDAIIPVPLHPTRLRERGYNQALELARPISRELGIPLMPELCIRRRITVSQANLKLDERRRNVRGAFLAKGHAPLRVAVVDDVITTGSTADAMAKTLRLAGADHVQIWALARTDE